MNNNCICNPAVHQRVLLQNVTLRLKDNICDKAKLPYTITGLEVAKPGIIVTERRAIPTCGGVPATRVNVTFRVPVVVHFVDAKCQPFCGTAMLVTTQSLAINAAGRPCPFVAISGCVDDFHGVTYAGNCTFLARKLVLKLSVKVCSSCCCDEEKDDDCCCDPCKKKIVLDKCRPAPDPCKCFDPCRRPDPCKPIDPCRRPDPCKPVDPCGRPHPCKPLDPCGKPGPCGCKHCRRDPCICDKLLWGKPLYPQDYNDSGYDLSPEPPRVESPYNLFPHLLHDRFK